METLGWTLCLPRLLDFFVFCFLIFLVLPVPFFLFWSKTLKKNKKTNLETLGCTLYLPRLLDTCLFLNLFFVFPRFFCYFLVLVKNLGKPIKEKRMETLGWTLYLPRFKRCYSTTPFGLPDSQGPIVILCFLDRKLFHVCGSVFNT